MNERTNRLLHRFIPKGTSIQNYSDREILQAADEINAMLRKRLGYAAPEDLFEEQLDRIYRVMIRKLYSDEVFNLLLQFSDLFQSFIRKKHS